ncbi:MAG: tRNA (guanosine(37)-N1)-methyltransferase TrmD [Christensenellales bacterium]|jgi:tRNA (guanine37-N1)-methyltransferase
MKIDVLTLFPEMFAPINASILKRAQENNLLSLEVANIRDYSKDTHRKCDDYPYGGGNGMVMTPQPLYDSIMDKKTPNSKVIYLSPKGKVFNQKKAISLAKEEHLIFVCGHYEGVDERVLQLCVDEEISIGDFVLTGGELACMVVIDALARNIAGVLGNEESKNDESFSLPLLEYPQYTRPQVFEGLEVPQVLLSGNHKEVDKFRLEQSIEITKQRRPDLYEKYLKMKDEK